MAVDYDGNDDNNNMCLWTKNYQIRPIENTCEQYFFIRAMNHDASNNILCSCRCYYKSSVQCKRYYVGIGLIPSML